MHDPIGVAMNDCQFRYFERIIQNYQEYRVYIVYKQVSFFLTFFEIPKNNLLRKYTIILLAITFITIMVGNIIVKTLDSDFEWKDILNNMNGTFTLTILLIPLIVYPNGGTYYQLFRFSFDMKNRSIMEKTPIREN